MIMSMQRPRRTAVPSFQRSASTGEKVDYEIERLCGHIEVIQIFAGSNPDTSKWVQAQRDKDCRECYQAKMVEADQASVDAGKRVALEGGPKQVPWAQSVRQGRASEMRTWLESVTAVGAGAVKAGRLSKADYDAGIADVRAGFTDLMMGVEFSDDDYDHSGYAKWWIDTRKDALDTIIARLLPDRDILGTGVFTRLSADGWTPAEDATLLPVEVELEPEPEPVQRTATPLPGTAPEPFNPHARGRGRGPVKVVSGPAAATWQREADDLDLEDAPF